MSIASRAELVERVRAEFERTLYNRTDNRTSTEVIVDSTLAAVVEMLWAQLRRNKRDTAGFGLAYAIALLEPLQAPAEGERG